MLEPALVRLLSGAIVSEAQGKVTLVGDRHPARPMPVPSRRQVLEVALLAGIGGAAAAASARAAIAKPLDLKDIFPKLRDLRDVLHREVRDWLRAQTFPRPQTFTYTVDVGQLL